MQRNRPRTAALVTATALFLAFGGAAAAVDRPTAPGELTLINTSSGQVLADKDGNPLYARPADTNGTPGCTGGCASTWPAAVGSPKRARGVTGALTRTSKHAAGSTSPQVVFGTHPLYYYENDKPGRPRGQNIKGFSLIAPSGRALTEPVRATKKAVAPAQKSAGPAKSPRQTTSSTSRPEQRGASTAPPGRRTTTDPGTTPKPKPKDARSDSVPAPPSGLAVGPSARASGGTATGTATAPTTNTGTPSTGTPATTATGSSTASASVGALAVTPSGAARGGAVHPTTARAADPLDAAELSLAIGITAIATAGALLVIRRLQRPASGGRH